MSTEKAAPLTPSRAEIAAADAETPPQTMTAEEAEAETPVDDTPEPAATTAPATLDATSRQRVSVTHERSVQVTSDAECELRLTLLGKTSSAGHRFKLTRVVVEAQTS